MPLDFSNKFPGIGRSDRMGRRQILHVMGMGTPRQPSPDRLEHTRALFAVGQEKSFVATERDLRRLGEDGSDETHIQETILLMLERVVLPELEKDILLEPALFGHGEGMLSAIICFALDETFCDPKTTRAFFACMDQLRRSKGYDFKTVKQIFDQFEDTTLPLKHREGWNRIARMF